MNNKRWPMIASLVACSLLFAGCASLRTGDGPRRTGSSIPPDFPGNAVPRAEPRSRYGNGPYYDVYGQTYKVMNSSHGYKERGVASWYGKKFHGRMTSSQEPYDMYAMTAAHKELPLPTYVRVRNLKNDRSIVVRVNDRGPFVENRLIDLSYSAALKLDMVRAGTGLVEVTAISFDAPGPPATIPSANETQGDDAGIYIQVGAFGDRSNADRRFRVLQRNRFRQAFVYADERQGSTLYRVRIGPIADVSQYDLLIRRLREIGISDAQLISD